MTSIEGLLQQLLEQGFQDIHTVSRKPSFCGSSPNPSLTLKLTTGLSHLVEDLKIVEDMSVCPVFDLVCELVSEKRSDSLRIEATQGCKSLVGHSNKTIQGKIRL